MKIYASSPLRSTSHTQGNFATTRLSILVELTFIPIFSPHAREVRNEYCVGAKKRCAVTQRDTATLRAENGAQWDEGPKAGAQWRWRE